MPPQLMGETLSRAKPVQEGADTADGKNEPELAPHDQHDQVGPPADNGTSQEGRPGTSVDALHVPTTPTNQVIPAPVEEERPLVSILRKPRAHWHKQSLNRCRVALIDIDKLGRKFWCVGEKYKKSKERPGVYLRVASREKGRALLDYEFACKKTPNKVKFNNEVRLKFIRKSGSKKCAETHGEQMKDYPIWPEVMQEVKLNVEYDSELEKTDSEESCVDAPVDGADCALSNILCSGTPPLNDRPLESEEPASSEPAASSSSSTDRSFVSVTPPLGGETWPSGKPRGKTCVRRLRWGKRRRNRFRRFPERTETRLSPERTGNRLSPKRPENRLSPERPENRHSPERVIETARSLPVPVVADKMEEIINLLSEVESMLVASKQNGVLQDRIIVEPAIPAPPKQYASSSDWDVDSEEEQERARSFLSRSVGDA